MSKLFNNIFYGISLLLDIGLVITYIGFLQNYKSLTFGWYTCILVSLYIISHGVFIQLYNWLTKK